MAKKTRFCCPTNCPVCHSKYEGGAVRPHEPMKEGLRVFYACGSMRVRTNGEQIIIIVNCHKKPLTKKEV